MVVSQVIGFIGVPPVLILATTYSDKPTIFGLRFIFRNTQLLWININWWTCLQRQCCLFRMFTRGTWCWPIAKPNHQQQHPTKLSIANSWLVVRVPKVATSSGYNQRKSIMSRKEYVMIGINDSYTSPVVVGCWTAFIISNPDRRCPINQLQMVNDGKPTSNHTNNKPGGPTITADRICCKHL